MNEDNGAMRKGHPIRVVAQRTGLTTPVIRAWERRYGTISPARSDSGQRVYSEADIERLKLLAALVERGRGIGTIAALPTDSLEALLEEDLAAMGGPGSEAESSVEDLVAQAMVLVEELRPEDLERLLMRSALALRMPEVVEGVLIPLLHEIGRGWQTGRFGPGSEHVATVTIRRFLEWLSTTIQTDEDAPILVTGTPIGQRHEFGALLAGLVGADEGWQIRFLGPDLPCDEIVRGAESFGAAAVALSAIQPDLEPVVVQDVIRIRRKLTRRIELIIGGPAADPHADAWKDAGVQWYPDMAAFRSGLGRIREVRF